MNAQKTVFSDTERVPSYRDKEFLGTSILA
jgi:hypothetical protein